jgi:hypothetical protein
MLFPQVVDDMLQDVAVRHKAERPKEKDRRDVFLDVRQRRVRRLPHHPGGLKSFGCENHSKWSVFGRSDPPGDRKGGWCRSAVVRELNLDGFKGNLVGFQHRP